MNQIDFVNFFSAFLPWGLLKLAIVLLLLIYLIFAAVIVRQEQLMSRVVEIPISPILKILVMIHLGASIIALLLAIILL